MAGSGRCFHCKESGCVAMNFPQRVQSTGRVFMMQAEAADPDTTLLTGIPF
ncbi:hypothetical protein F511_20372 [Dorcoceras hygrometricum]|uniref:Uncharacterized protein n=1 Tax=Dorcoceras hygrometricum TaxID=472368 RepID=A0A2Z7CRU4_9LAMI|nr:hypothetical protein F511_20372 [Dorcoceras hygrometricum]